MKKILLIIIVIASSVIVSSNAYAEKEVSPIAVSKPVGTRQLGLKEKGPVLPDSAMLDVPLLNQLDPPRLYNGCEVTSLAMLLQFNGINVTKNELADKVKKVPLTYSNGQKGNPNAGFVGDMANGPGLSVFNGPIAALAKEYVGDQVVNLTNSPFTDLLKKVARGEPVWIITTTTFTPVSFFEVWNTPQGKVNITLKGHSVVITGFDKDYIYINDPYGYKNRKVNRDSFIKTWEQMGKQAIVIEK
jgi:uncharacterized protein YvpB